MGRVKLNPFSSDQLSSLLMGEAGKPKKNWPEGCRTRLQERGSPYFRGGI